MTPPWMLARLGVETAIHHAAADEERLRALTLTRVDAYRAFLARIFGFEAVVERLLLRFEKSEELWLRSRMRTPMLRDDLRALGSSDTELARLPLSTAIHIPSFAHGLGWMFVLERQTLLAGLIRRQLMRRLGASLVDGCRYFGACGERPGRSIRQFGETLGELAARHPAALMVQGANEAFRAQHQWYALEQTNTEADRRRAAMISIATETIAFSE